MTSVGYNFFMRIRLAFIAVLISVFVNACSGSDSQGSSEAPMVDPKPCPTFAVSEGEEIPQDQADLLIGMVEADAESCAEGLGWKWRVGERDGEFYALTMDYRPDRVTVQIQEGIIYLVNVG